MQRRVRVSAIFAVLGALVLGIGAIGSLAQPNVASSPATAATPTSIPSAVTPVAPATASAVVPAPASAPAGTAQALLAALGQDDAPDSHAGYSRDLFKLWIDADGNGCNTRAEVLMSESETSTTHTSTCTVATGKWFSSYDGIWITVARQLDIDHFVPLSEAWKSGAYRWDTSTRTAFANDLGDSASLIAVSASTNRSKGDKDPSAWMPPNASFACTYVSTWVAVKYRWSLTVDARERSAIARVLEGCGPVTMSVPQRASMSAG